LPARDALSGPATAPDDPASAFLTTARPASADQSEQQCRPCGFPPCEHDAVRLDMRTARLRFRTSNTRRVNPAAKCACETSCQLVAWAGIVRWNRFDPLRSDPSRQAPPLRLFAARSRSCIVALSWRDVPLPSRAFAAWPIRVVLPSCPGRRRSWGLISALRRFAPAAGDRSFLIGRAHVPVRPAARPDLFSSGRSAAA